MRKWLFISVLAAMAASLAASPGTAQQQRQSNGPPAGSGFDVRDLDTTCRPCQDFYQFATGGWKKRNPIGPSYANWARFTQLQEKNQLVLRGILEAAAAARPSSRSSAADAGPESLDQKLGDFYGACMDEKTIEADGVKPLAPEMARIAAISNLGELQAEVARFHLHGIRALFRFGAGQDDKNSEQIIAQASQGGLALPDRDYYTKQDERSKKLRDQYERHTARMFRLAGDDADTAAASARTILALETKLAEASKTRVQRRDPLSNYHKLSLSDLDDLTPAFSWTRYFQNVGFPDIREVNVGQPEFFRALNELLRATPLADWKMYLRWQLLDTSAPALSSKFVNENFAFYNRTLTGVKEIQPRWRRCVASTDRALGEALGEKYVAVAFPPEAKAKAEAMVADLVASLRSDLDSLPWMGESTRREALAKLASISLKIGYPEKWRDYSAYHVAQGPYIENLRRGDAFEFHRALAKIGRPVDRTEWQMTPPTVNAYYDASMNEIVFPAGILQPPFFDAQADDALNYGGIGAVIGHEMTHGFDDQGRQYDAKGNLRDWWTPEDLKNFQARAACVENQFSSFVVDGDLHENGKLVLGESIADLGGLTIAHLALQRALARQGGQVPAKTIEGFTPEQRFFLAFARIWAANARPEYERMQVVTDTHPLPRFRAAGTISNMPEFAAAFACPAASAMLRAADAQCKIW